VILLADNDEPERLNARAAFTELTRFARSAGGNSAGPFRRLGIEMAKFEQPDETQMGHLLQNIKQALDPDGIMKPLPLSKSAAR
jgi:FAD/FMN-containing dehydrogenase